MAQIIERTVLGETNKRLSLTKEQIARTISIGTNWNSIRIGFRHSVSFNHSGALPAPGIWGFGLCSGTSNLLLDSTTDHFLGIRTTGGGYSADNFTTTNSIQIYWGNWLFSKKVGTTFTDSTYTTSDSSYPQIMTTVHEYGTGAWLIEIIKGDPNYTWNVYSPSARYRNGTGQNIDYYKFITSINNYNVNRSTEAFHIQFTGSLPVNETLDGALDTINIAWQPINETLEISDVAYAILE